jgi:hypothetical protein
MLYKIPKKYLEKPSHCLIGQTLVFNHDERGKGKKGRNSLVPRILERHLVVNMTEGIDEEASKGCRRGVGMVRAHVHGDRWMEKRKRTCLGIVGPYI